MITILKKDLANYFKSPIAYVTTTFLLLLCGYLFFIRVVHYSMVSMQAMMNPMYAKSLLINDQIVVPLLNNTAFLMLFFTPLFTMRLFSEEKKLGTLELLFTYPLTETQLIFGKLFSCAAVVLLGGLLTATFPLTLFKYVQNMDWSSVITGYLGIVLMSIAAISIGMWISSLTDSQIVAAFSTFASLLMFWIIGWTGTASPGPLSKFLTSISFLDNFDNFTKGVIDLNSVLFFVCFSILFLYLTYYNLISRKWRG
ncbi:MAG: ABC transporter permease subunit [Candidatus Eremiobacteraeota bacterium]|nr:ABC transporter permease subunit [Candidatus Eremiobacteraeota bacterium]